MALKLKPLLRILRVGSIGDDVIFCKRCLARAGHGSLKGITRVFGPFMRTHVKRFQKQKGLRQDGVVGEVTFNALQRYADDYAWTFYEKRRKKQQTHTPHVVMGQIRLPQYFHSTHPTGGLPGYPAIDVFGKPYTTIGAPENGRVIRLSGKSPSLGGVPGGAYGWTTYIRGDSGATYFITHQAYRSVVLGQRVIRGQKIGAMADCRVAHMPTYLTHTHIGKHGP